MQNPVFVGDDFSVDLRDDAFRHLEGLREAAFLYALLEELLAPFLFPERIHLKCEPQQIVTVEDCERRGTNHGFSEVVASVHAQTLRAAAAFAGHEAEIRNAVVLFGPVVAGLFFQVIAALGRDFEARASIAGAFCFVFISSEEFEPFLCKPHSAVLLKTSVLSGFTCDDGVPYSFVFLGWILEKLDLCGDLF